MLLSFIGYYGINLLLSMRAVNIYADFVISDYSFVKFVYLRQISLYNVGYNNSI